MHYFVYTYVLSVYICIHIHVNKQNCTHTHLVSQNPMSNSIKVLERSPFVEQPVEQGQCALEGRAVIPRARVPCSWGRMSSSKCHTLQKWLLFLLICLVSSFRRRRAHGGEVVWCVSRARAAAGRSRRRGTCACPAPWGPGPTLTPTPFSLTSGRCPSWRRATGAAPRKTSSWNHCPSTPPTSLRSIALGSWSGRNSWPD